MSVGDTVEVTGRPYGDCPELNYQIETSSAVGTRLTVVKHYTEPDGAELSDGFQYPATSFKIIRSHPMTTNPKPLLTRRELVKFICDCGNPECEQGGYHRIKHTIERMAELLAEQCTDICCDGPSEPTCEPCQRKHDFLSTFNATGGEGS